MGCNTLPKNQNFPKTVQWITIYPKMVLNILNFAFSVVVYNSLVVEGYSFQVGLSKGFDSKVHMRALKKTKTKKA